MNHVLTSGSRVGAEGEEHDGEMFGDKMKRLVAELRVQQTNATKLDHNIAVNLEELKCGR